MKDSVKRVADALAAVGIESPIIEFAESTRTAQEAARAVGTTASQIVKSLVFVAGSEPVLVLASGTNRVDLAKVAAVLNAPVSRPDAAAVRAATGFSIGGVPPLGHVTPLRTLMDHDLLRFAEVYAAAGTPNAVFRVAPDTLARVTQAVVVDIAEATH